MFFLGAGGGGRSWDGEFRAAGSVLLVWASSGVSGGGALGGAGMGVAVSGVPVGEVRGAGVRGARQTTTG